jgi:amidohydrolase
MVASPPPAQGATSPNRGESHTQLRADIAEILPGVIADRRHFHENPELGYQEFKTSQFVAERLQALGVEDLRTGVAKTGITALIRGTAAGPAKTALIRADMDALPIEEENETVYRSQIPGVMHACGHDGHTAMLLGIARILLDRRDEFSGTVKLLFQPSEELPPGGAKPMIDEGALENPHVDAVFGMHLAQDTPLGKIILRAGPAMASADAFRIVIKGKGGHGAHPESTIDPIVVGSQIVVALQTIVSREVDPNRAAVVTVGAFRSGVASNVIPDTAELRGTVRSFHPEVRQQLADRIRALVQGIAKAMRAEAEINYEFGYPPVVNEPKMTALVREVAVETVGAENVVDGEPIMAAEDFSYFLNERPGCFFNVGSMNEEKGLVWTHHHPKFDFDEEALGVGMETMVRSVLRFLDE